MEYHHHYQCSVQKKHPQSITNVLRQNCLKGKSSCRLRGIHYIIGSYQTSAFLEPSTGINLLKTVVSCQVYDGKKTEKKKLRKAHSNDQCGGFEVSWKAKTIGSVTNTSGHNVELIRIIAMMMVAVIFVIIVIVIIIVIIIIDNNSVFPSSRVLEPAIPHQRDRLIQFHGRCLRTTIDVPTPFRTPESPRARGVCQPQRSETSAGETKKYPWSTWNHL